MKLLMLQAYIGNMVGIYLVMIKERRILYGLFGKNWLKSVGDDDLRSKKSEIETDTDWRSGSILNGDFDDEIEAIAVMHYGAWLLFS